MYLKPGALVRAMNGFIGRIAAFGLGPSKTVLLEVRGRRSGELRSVAVNTLDHEGQRYLVAPRGETEWVRNVRAASGDASLRRGGREKVRLEELPVDQRATVIKAYLAENAITTKSSFGLEPDAAIEEFERIAPNHPVFRIIAAQAE
ncbi:MAG: nitroreductase/quinone reductase family protein [Dehalococcoidia bacterium]